MKQFGACNIVVFVVVVVVMASLADVAVAYAVGAPVDRCDSMRPSHGGGEDLRPSPFAVLALNNTYYAGEEIYVQFDGPPYRGFMLQARNQTGHRVGTFAREQLPTGTQILQCERDTNNAVTHQNNRPKVGLKFTWRAPITGGVGTINFYATIVRYYRQIWVKLMSEDVIEGAPVEPTTEPEPTTEAEAEADAKAEAEAESKSTGAQKSESKAEAEAEAEAEGEADTKDEVESEIADKHLEKTLAESESEAEGEAEAESEPETGEKAEGKAETENEPKAEADGEAEAEPEVATEAEGKAVTRGKVEADTKAGGATLLNGKGERVVAPQGTLEANSSTRNTSRERKQKQTTGDASDRLTMGKAGAVSAEPAAEGEPEDEKKKTETEMIGEQETMVKPEPEPEGTGEPEPEGTGEPEPEGTGKPEPEGTGEPEPEGTGEPEPEGTGEPKPEGTGKPEPEGTGEPEPEGTGKPEPNKGASAEPETTSMPKSKGSGKATIAKPPGDPLRSAAATGKPDPLTFEGCNIVKGCFRHGERGCTPQTCDIVVMYSMDGHAVTFDIEGKADAWVGH
ncbi:PREDICTED: retinitis pigmentosa 1-like 1 protein [Priapulus caudatus]|uniref:Retinitis pigmentosa 1-like 1 protein n=1 Tax=Priapulus caudatus TaxID=37621 RepID=A0ABM1E2L0_PRICU|nr:PREDICTED: retinitis pigmentosa 1-like 1 protein [Priapulus caudatus]